jgi:hypothetical protein
VLDKLQQNEITCISRNSIGLYRPLGRSLPHGRNGAAQCCRRLFALGSSLFRTTIDFATAVEKIKQTSIELILGCEATELLCKMEQVKQD